MSYDSGGTPLQVRQSDRIVERSGQDGRGSSAAQLLGGARQTHGTLSRAFAAALYFVRPQINNVAHVAEAVTANATAMLTRSGMANRPLLSLGRPDVGVFYQEHGSVGYP